MHPTETRFDMATRVLVLVPDFLGSDAEAAASVTAKVLIKVLGAAVQVPARQSEKDAGGRCFSNEREQFEYAVCVCVCEIERKQNITHCDTPITHCWSKN